MRDTILRRSLTAAVMGATLLGGSAVFAQTPAAEEPATAPSVTAPATPIDEQKIEKFADAYVAVQTIQRKATDQLNKVGDDPAKQQQEQAKVESEMIAAVERTGLKLDEFNGIVQTMTADATLREKIIAEIRERTGG